ncbi:MAG: phasin family protein [Bacteroidota bacterium]
MEDLFKKIIYTSAGMVAATAEKLQKGIDELVEKGKITKEEGKKVVDDLKEDTESRKKEFEEKVKDVVDNVFKTFKVPSPGEMEKLYQRIEALEAKVEELTPKKPAAKRGRPKKTTTTTKKTTASRTRKTPPKK